jgi:hypothetical protein
MLDPRVGFAAASSSQIELETFHNVVTMPPSSAPPALPGFRLFKLANFRLKHGGARRMTSPTCR